MDDLPVAEVEDVRHREDGDPDPERLDEAVGVAERERTHDRSGPVRADDEVEAAPRRPCERDIDAIGRLLEARDRVAVNAIDRRGLTEQPREIVAKDLDVAAPKRPPVNVRSSDR